MAWVSTARCVSPLFELNKAFGLPPDRFATIRHESTYSSYSPKNVVILLSQWLDLSITSPLSLSKACLCAGSAKSNTLGNINPGIPGIIGMEGIIGICGSTFSKVFGQSFSLFFRQFFVRSLFRPQFRHFRLVFEHPSSLGLGFKRHQSSPNAHAISRLDAVFCPVKSLKLNVFGAGADNFLSAGNKLP